ncbi:hypothetical protein LWC08_05465 [Desulfobaculum bizertense]|uniref:FlgO family outer membrane protein n=1 Tax=Desulfobaculum bizertense TaxID=376490 RepID=UPI001EEAADE2|nr:FlgO family outer membrane protein [Desulfobaculum bizertense]UIJ39022.1 hypothetical protein LWC08_05465 [Desulfobaculum bizertense]
MNKKKWISAALLLALCAPQSASAVDSLLIENTHSPSSGTAQKDALSVDPGTGVSSDRDGWIHEDGQTRSLRSQGKIHPGVMVPDGDGGYIWLHSANPLQAPDVNQQAAQELRLKIRELAQQILDSDVDLTACVTIPVSFVHQDNLQQSSPFGRLVAEQMYNELKRQHMNVVEFRSSERVRPRPQQGEFALSRDISELNQKRTVAILTGTYYYDANTIFVNGRLFQKADGKVLGTGSITIPQNATTLALLKSQNRPMRKLRAAEIELRSFDEMKDSRGLGYVLDQKDLH